MAPFFRTVAIALLLPASLAGWAAEERPVSEAPKDKATWLDIRTSELTGKKVVNPQGRSLGEVQDVMIDVRRSTVASLALSSGGVGGVGDKQTLVPPKAFTRGESRDRLVLDMDEKKLAAQAGAGKAEPGMRRAKDLMGQNVTDAQGKAVGEIEDLVVNLGTGRVEQVVLAPDGRKAPEAKRMLPLSAFAIPEREGKIVLK